MRQSTNNGRLRLFNQYLLEECNITTNGNPNTNRDIIGFDNMKTNYFINEKSKRAKERAIVEIIHKVYLWKKLYQGIEDNKGNRIKLTSKEAAEHTQISHKSLDEYYNQLKLGKMLGFDFNKYKDDRFGVLRGFIKSKAKNVDPFVMKQLKSKKKCFDSDFGSCVKFKTRDNTSDN